MSVAASKAPSQLLSPEQAAEYLGIRKQTLAAWRCSGRHDLPFLRVGKAIRYRQGDIDAWLAARTATSTSR